MDREREERVKVPAELLREVDEMVERFAFDKKSSRS